MVACPHVWPCILYIRSLNHKLLIISTRYVGMTVKTLLGVIEKSKAVTIMGLEAEVKGTHLSSFVALRDSLAT
jgi:hypothetical protein